MNERQTSVVRYGVIGTGMMGVEHIHNIGHLHGAEVVAVADPHDASLAKGAAAVESVGGPVRAYSDYQDMLSSGGIDAVVIVTPNHTHADVLADVFDAGLHVMVEKPLCTTVPDCQRVIKRAQGYPGVIWMGLEYRWMPPVATLIDHVRGGACGPVRMVAIREHRFPFQVKIGDWNRFSVNTGGTLVEKCCHFFDLMNQVTGERPVRVMASGAQDVNHLDERYPENPAGEVPDILDNAYVIVEYPSGARAMLDLCMFAEAGINEQELCVVGARGKVEALIPQGKVRVGTRGADRWDHSVIEEDVTGAHIPYQGFHHGSSWVEHARFVECIRTGRPADVTLEDGLWSVAMGVAAHRSIDERRPVDLAEVLT